MPCIQKIFFIPPGIYFGNGVQTSITTPADGYYALSITFVTNPIVAGASVMKVYVYVNGNQVYSQLVTSDSTLPLYVTLGNLSQGTTVTVAFSIYGTIGEIGVIVNLGYIAEGEYCAYASYFNIPILSGVKGAVCVMPNQYINVYEGCVEITGVPCVDCPAPPKTISLRGQLQPGINYITINTSGPLSGEIISQIQQTFSPGTTFDNVKVISTTVSGNTVTIKVEVTEAQANPYVIIAIAVLVFAIALAISLITVTIKATKILAVGYSVGVALLLGGVGIGIAMVVYDRFKKRKS